MIGILWRILAVSGWKATTAPMCKRLVRTLLTSKLPSTRRRRWSWRRRSSSTGRDATARTRVMYQRVNWWARRNMIGLAVLFFRTSTAFGWICLTRSLWLWSFLVRRSLRWGLIGSIRKSLRIGCGRSLTVIFWWIFEPGSCLLSNMKCFYRRWSNSAANSTSTWKKCRNSRWTWSRIRCRGVAWRRIWRGARSVMSMGAMSWPRWRWRICLSACYKN